MGAGRPGFAGPRAAFAAPGFRARCAGDESHDKHHLRLRIDLCDLSLKLGWATDEQAVELGARSVGQRAMSSPKALAHSFAARSAVPMSENFSVLTRCVSAVCMNAATTWPVAPSVA